MIEPIPLSSVKADHYAKLRTRLAIQKASECEAIAAIDELCHDNERLALRSQASVAAALEAAADICRDISEAALSVPVERAMGRAGNAIRALITQRDHDALAAHVAAENVEIEALRNLRDENGFIGSVTDWVNYLIAEVAEVVKARSGDAAKIARLEQEVTDVYQRGYWAGGNGA